MTDGSFHLRVGLRAAATPLSFLLSENRRRICDFTAMLSSQAQQTAFIRVE
jgi:hypothetical protein